jgi:hypothetical protein
MTDIRDIEFLLTAPSLMPYTLTSMAGKLLFMMRFSSQLLAVLATSPLVWAYDTQQPLVPSESTISQPLIGFGTWNLDISDKNTTEAVSLAIQAGYRQIDCATAYRNEKAVGKGIADGLKKANLTRNEIWVTSKLWNDQSVTLL